MNKKPTASFTALSNLAIKSSIFQCVTVNTDVQSVVYRAKNWWCVIRMRTALIEYGDCICVHCTSAREGDTTNWTVTLVLVMTTREPICLYLIGLDLNIWFKSTQSDFVAYFLK